MHPVIDYRSLVRDTWRSLHEVTKALPSGAFPVSLRHLIDIRVSQINGCQFCLNLHRTEAERDGDTPERLDAIAGWRDSPLFTPAERNALAWAEILTRGGADGRALDVAIKDMAAHFDEEAICRITFAIATINAWNRVGVAFWRHDDWDRPITTP